MNTHEILDRLSVGLGALTLGKNRFFCRRIDSPPFCEHLEAIELEVPQIEMQGGYQAVAKTLAGRLDPGFYVARWLGEEHPTVIYHHGNNERPFDFSHFSRNSFMHILLSEKEPVQANLIALRAPFHRHLPTYIGKIPELNNFVAMLSVSVKLEEELISRLKEGHSRVMAAGMSLGGWVTNLHRAHFNTADVYVPVLAGASLGDMFLSSAYQRMTGRLARDHPREVRSILDFREEFERVADDNVFPLLARHDQIVQMEVQSKCYGHCPLAILEKGHLTGCSDYDSIRRHILQHL
ncbi:MAG: hypothetical protein GKC10_00330 [Methanosarcinales archaeon]|nr:hypothetical protein [Methanosarcinales archaeon]